MRLNVEPFGGQRPEEEPALPFRCLLADPRLIAQLSAFAGENSFPDLYRAYSWRNDAYANGFPDIYRLESRLIGSDRTNGITLNDVKAVAEWGSWSNP